MKKLLSILLVGLLMGCQEGNLQKESENTEFTYSNGLATLTLQMYTINGCQYIGSLRGCDNDVLTHMGDCDNTIHAPIVMYSDTTLFNPQDTIK